MSWLLVSAGLLWLAVAALRRVLADGPRMGWLDVAVVAALCLSGAAVYVAELVLTGARHG